MGRMYEDVRGTFVRDNTVGLGGQKTGTSQGPSNNMVNVVLTNVAWSIPQTVQGAGDTNRDTSLIAAAGSNGVIVVWRAETLLAGGPGNPPAPDAILSQHVRAVNRLAWHPKRPGLLLSASQDGTVLLWERRKVATAQRESQNTSRQGFSLFGSRSTQSNDQKRSYSWQCRATFSPKSEAVRDIRWSKFYDDGTYIRVDSVHACMYAS